VVAGGLDILEQRPAWVGGGATSHYNGSVDASASRKYRKEG
jgi:hypothetical protein